MKLQNIFTPVLMLASIFAFTACNDDNPNPVDQTTDKYVLITLADRVSGSKAGFISTFDEYPSDTVSNASAGSLEGQGMGGWRTYNNMIFKMFRTSDYATGIEKILINKDGASKPESLSPQKIRPRRPNTTAPAIL